MSGSIRGVADQLAADGFIAVAPDLLAGHGANGGDTASLANQQEITQATLTLPAAEIASKLAAARQYGLKLPSANGKSGSVGFCFGGNQSFAFAVTEAALNAAVVYYGTAPTDVAAAPRGGGAGGGGAAAPPAGGGGGGRRGGGGAPATFVPSDRLTNIKAPVIGMYGGADARVNASIPATEMKMKELGKIYEPHVFDGAAHGFLRAQSGNDGANMKATEQAWPLPRGSEIHSLGSRSRVGDCHLGAATQLRTTLTPDPYRRPRLPTFSSQSDRSELARRRGGGLIADGARQHLQRVGAVLPPSTRPSRRNRARSR